MDLAKLRADDFEALTERTFQVQCEESQNIIELELEKVLRCSDRLAEQAAEEGLRPPFTLTFLGPPEPVMPQRMYPVRHEELGEIDLFIVPTGPRDSKMVYTVVFG